MGQRTIILSAKTQSHLANALSVAAERFREDALTTSREFPHAAESLTAAFEEQVKVAAYWAELLTIGEGVSVSMEYFPDADEAGEFDDDLIEDDDPE